MSLRWKVQQLLCAATRKGGRTTWLWMVLSLALLLGGCKNSGETDASGGQPAQPQQTAQHASCAAGTFQLQWGGLGQDNGLFRSPTGVAVGAQGNVYISDQVLSRIQKFDSAGRYLTQWGSAGSGEGQFKEPYGVAVDAQGNVYVASRFSHRVQKFDAQGAFLLQWGSYGSGDGQFDSPFGVAVDGQGNVYVSDQGNHRIQKFCAGP